MTREEIVAFLKENLSLSVGERYAEKGDGRWMEIKLLLCGEAISTQSLPAPDFSR